MSQELRTLQYAFVGAAAVAGYAIATTGLDDDGSSVLVAVALVFGLGALGRASRVMAAAQVVCAGLLLFAIAADVAAAIDNWLVFAGFVNSVGSLGRRFVGRVVERQRA